jgi:hypothetical protein
VVVAAHCIFCLGADAPLAVRFVQFADVFTLHKHIKDHLIRELVPRVCPHPLCGDQRVQQSVVLYG